MKKLLIVLFAIAVSFSACQKKSSTDSGSGSGSTTLTVQKVNKAMLFDFSETWCPPCGAYGGPSFDACLTMEKDTICPMKVYASSSPGTMNAAVSNAMGNSFNVSGVPTFFVNEQELNSGGGVYSSVSSNVNWVKSKATAFAATTVNAGVALSKSISGTTLTVKTKTKFFTSQAASKDLRLAIYVVEDHIIAAQQVTGQGTVSTYEHRNLLRDCNASVYTGENLNAGAAIAVDEEFSKEFTFTLNSAWKTANIKVIAAIWDVPSSGKAKLVNSNMVK